MTFGKILAATALGAALAAAGPVSADPKHCPPGHAKKGWCGDRGHGYRDRDRYGDRDRYDDRDRYGDRDRYDDRDREERAYEEGYRDGQYDAWRRGDRIPRDRYRVIEDYDRYGLRYPGDGYRYVEVDDRILLIAAATGLIVDILGSR